MERGSKPKKDSDESSTNDNSSSDSESLPFNEINDHSKDQCDSVVSTNDKKQNNGFDSEIADKGKNESLATHSMLTKKKQSIENACHSEKNSIGEDYYENDCVNEKDKSVLDKKNLKEDEVPIGKNNSFAKQISYGPQNQNVEIQTSCIDTDSYSSSEESDLKELDNKEKKSDYTKLSEIEVKVGPSSISDGTSFTTYFPLKFLAIFVIAILAIVYANLSDVVIDDAQGFTPGNKYDLKIKEFGKKLGNLQTMFSNQDKRLWAIIRVAIEEHHLTTDNIQPAVLMFVSSEKGTNTAECLAKKIANLYSNGFRQSDLVRGIDLQGMNSDAAKLKLDQDITHNFKSGSKSVVVSRFEKIPARATTTFYQFCENDHAPFKDVAVIITVQVDEGPWSISSDLDNMPIKLWDRVISDFLEHSLNSRDPNTMTRDMISGLLSRITPSVAWVKPENNVLC